MLDFYEQYQITEKEFKYLSVYAMQNDIFSFP